MTLRGEREVLFVMAVLLGGHRGRARVTARVTRSGRRPVGPARSRRTGLPTMAPAYRSPPAQTRPACRSLLPRAGSAAARPRAQVRRRGRAALRLRVPWPAAGSPAFALGRRSASLPPCLLASLPPCLLASLPP